MLWVLAAGVLGFVTPALFVGMLRLPRPVFLVVYAGISAAFLFGYYRWSRADLGQALRHQWLWGLAGAVLVGLFVVKNVLSQPASPSSSGLALAFDLLWLGVVYGTLDALLLSAMPIYAVWRSFSALGFIRAWPGRLVAGAVALTASLLVTAAYHAGYPEFRGPALAGPVIGNGVLGLAYLLTSNPLSSVIGHVAMHVAAVLHGPATTVQLPPHY
jgi:hypothetical protein